MPDPDFPLLATAEADIAGSFEDKPVAPTVVPCPLATAHDTSQPDWVEFVLVDDFDQPIANERYRVTLPDGKVKEGKLDDRGCVRVDGVAPGECEIEFPDLDDALAEAGAATDEPAPEEP
jgi:hypothetical protein